MLKSGLEVALSFTDSDVVGGISAVITYVVMLAVMGVMAQQRGVDTQALFGIPSIDTGVFGGVLAGAVAALLYNRYHRVELPPALAFFSGRRLVPVLCAGAGLLLGVSVAFVWPTLQGGIEQVSHWAVVTSPRTASSVYAFVERLLSPFGQTSGLALQFGKMMLELRPGGADKGAVIEQLLARAPFHGHRAVFMGDDVTDEDGFEAMQRVGGDGVLVGPERQSHAAWRLDDVEAVRWLLRASTGAASPRERENAPI